MLSINCDVFRMRVDVSFTNRLHTHAVVGLCTQSMFANLFLSIDRIMDKLGLGLGLILGCYACCMNLSSMSKCTRPMNWNHFIFCVRGAELRLMRLGLCKRN